MKYAKNGTLEDFFNKFIFGGEILCVSNDIIKNILKNIINGMIYIHDNDVIHMDIKSTNILMFENNPVISDFGMCISKSKRYINRKLKGTSSHMAPEIILNEKYNEKCDVWSFGCMICSILGIKLCQLNLNLYELRDYFLSYNNKYIEIDCDNISIKKFIEKCFIFDIEKRISFKELFENEILSESNCDLITYIIEKRALLSSENKKK
jgi:serine/threonine protein kinase